VVTLRPRQTNDPDRSADDLAWRAWTAPPSPLARCGGDQPAENEHSGRWFRDDRQRPNRPAQGALGAKSLEEEPAPWQRRRQVVTGPWVKKHLHGTEQATEWAAVHEPDDVHLANSVQVKTTQVRGAFDNPRLLGRRSCRHTIDRNLELRDDVEAEVR